MSITRINEFQAREGQGDALADLIGSFVPMIESSDGCLSCRLLRGEEDAARIVVIEEWESKSAHQASMKNIPPETMTAAMELLAGPPKGEYFRSAS